MTDSRREPVSSLWPHVALSAFAAVWISFTDIHRWHNSDSLLSSLASLYAWTPFFWQQDRVGLLVPLLTSICPDPVFNLVLQVGLMVFAGLCLPLLLAEVVFPHPTARSMVTIVSALMIAFAPDRIRDNLLMECYYPLAMALGCAALLLLGRGPGWPRGWRIALAATLLVLAHWVYVGVPLWLGPLALVRGWLQPGEPWPTSRWRKALRSALHPRTLLGCGLIVAAFAVGVGFMLWTQKNDPGVFIPTPRESLPPSSWPLAWTAFADRMAALPGMIGWCVVLQWVAGLAALTLLFGRVPRRYPIFTAVPVLLLPAAAEFLFMGTRAWTAQNGYHPRYLLGTIASGQVFWAVLAATPLAGWIDSRRRQRLFFAVAAGALFAGITYKYGTPALDRPREDVKRLGQPGTTFDLDEANVDAFGGNYWLVWPTVYNANLNRREQGRGDRFYGVTDRGRVMIARSGFSRDRPMRVAVLRNPDEHHWFLTYIPVCNLAPPVKIGDHGPFEIFETYPLAE